VDPEHDGEVPEFFDNRKSRIADLFRLRARVLQPIGVNAPIHEDPAPCGIAFSPRLDSSDIFEPDVDNLLRLPLFPAPSRSATLSKGKRTSGTENAINGCEDSQNETTSARRCNGLRFSIAAIFP